MQFMTLRKEAASPVGALTWEGVLLREERLRALVPLRR